MTAMKQPLGTLLVVSGPSGSGKTTLCRRATENGLCVYSISCTTRQPRPGEVNGVDYHFLTPAEFDARVERGDFLEYAEVHGNRYGTLKADILTLLEQGKNVVMDIDVQGAGQADGKGRLEEVLGEEPNAIHGGKPPLCSSLPEKKGSRDSIAKGPPDCNPKRKDLFIIVYKQVTIQTQFPAILTSSVEEKPSSTEILSTTPAGKQPNIPKPDDLTHKRLLLSIPSLLSSYSATAPRFP